MRLQRIRSRIQCEIACGHGIGERVDGFDDVGLDEILRDFGSTLPGFHGKAHVLISRT